MIVTIIFTVILAYLIGSIPTAVWIGKAFYGIDIRESGSGNAGATNTMRVLGWKAGVPVLLIDAFKGWFAIYLSVLMGIIISNHDYFVLFQITLGVAAVLGHVFPILAGFKGGKGVATLFGVGLYLYPVAVLILLGVFALLLIITDFVSLSSIIAAILFPVIEILILGHDQQLYLMLLSIAVGIFIPVTHRKNIARLLRGEEKKFRIKKK